MQKSTGKIQNEFLEGGGVSIATGAYFVNFWGKEKREKLIKEEVGRGERWVSGRLWELFVTYPHISGLGTHHGGCGGRGEDGGRGQTGREGREGVLVGVLVLVHVLVLVKLSPQ